MRKIHISKGKYPNNFYLFPTIHIHRICFNESYHLTFDWFNFYIGIIVEREKK